MFVPSFEVDMQCVKWLCRCDMMWLCTVSMPSTLVVTGKRSHCQAFLSMQALAQQQADFQQSVRCWQRRLHLQAADPVVFCIELQAANGMDLGLFDVLQWNHVNWVADQGITSEGRATRPTEGARSTTCPEFHVWTGVNSWKCSRQWIVPVVTIAFYLCAFSSGVALEVL